MDTFTAEKQQQNEVQNQAVAHPVANAVHLFHRVLAWKLSRKRVGYVCLHLVGCGSRRLLAQLPHSRREYKRIEVFSIVVLSKRR